MPSPTKRPSPVTEPRPSTMKPVMPSHIPSSQCSSTTDSNTAVSCPSCQATQSNIHHLLILRISPIPRPPTTTTTHQSSIPIPSTPATVDLFFTHEVGTNDQKPSYTASQPDTNTITPFSTLSFPISSKASTSGSSSTSSNKSTMTTVGDRQLRPHLPISYGKTLLKKLHGHQQIRTLNNMSIPPLRVTDEDASTSEENINSIDTLSTDYCKPD